MNIENFQKFQNFRKFVKIFKIGKLQNARECKIKNRQNSITFFKKNILPGLAH